MKTKSKVSAYLLRSAAATLLLSCVIVALSSAINLPNHPPKRPAPQNNSALGVNGQENGLSVAALAIQTNRTLTFADRVAYQRAIEDVYWQHRIWPKANPSPKPPLDKVMSQAQIEQKVEDYLRNSQALEDYWQRPITPDQLQAEMERMAQHTKQPEVLREVFAALENDPFVIAECLARPTLAERLITTLYSHDKRFHGELKRRAEAELAAHRSVSQMKQTSGMYTEMERIQSDSAETGSASAIAWLKEPLRSWVTRAETQVPVTMAVVSAGYTLPVISGQSDNSIPSVACSDNTWTPTSLTNAPGGREGHTAVWTGSEMIVWGGDFYDGTNFHYFNTGGRYNPSTDSWTATSTTNAPAARVSHTAVWTGSEMIVWGGVDSSGISLNTGARYNPSTDSWTAISNTNAPDGRFIHTAVWTGSQMIVWGGYNVSSFFNTGGKYNPSTDSWTATSMTNAPAARDFHTAVWTGSQMIVWGGYDGGVFNTGGRYNPSTDSWTATSTTGAPGARFHHTAVWTGSEMIVWGGADSSGNTGGRYNPGTNSWTATSNSNVPAGRYSHTAVWTGSEMIVWGGSNGSSVLNTGGRYNSSTDNWVATSTTNAPAARGYHTAVWTGSQMIVWGGQVWPNYTYLNTGGRYCAQSGVTSGNRFDFNGDGKTDYVLLNASTHQTAVWYLNNNVYIGGGYGPTLPAGWMLVDVADFNGDGKSDYALFNPSTRQTAIWYLNNRVYVGGGYGPSLPGGWQLLAVADFSGDGKPDYVLYNPATHQTAIWYLNDNVYVSGGYGPTVPAGWQVVGAADFNSDALPDYLLFNPTSRQSAIWYMSGRARIGATYGPTIATGFQLVGAADFNGNGKPDYILFNASTRRTAIWYLNNNVYVSGTYGPTLPAGWSLVAP